MSCTALGEGRRGFWGFWGTQSSGSQCVWPCMWPLCPLVHLGPIPFKSCTALGTARTLTLPRLPRTLPFPRKAPLMSRTLGLQSRACLPLRADGQPGVRRATAHHLPL